MSRYNKIFDDEGNLTMESRILYAYAMHLSRVDELPLDLVEHFWNNEQSRSQIIELYELYDDELIAQHPHPFFESQSKEKVVVDFDWENLDASLEQLLRSALSEQSQTNQALERKMVTSFKTSAATFEVNAPQKDTVCVQNITFQFKHPLPEEAALHFKNAKGKTVSRYTVPKGSTIYNVSTSNVTQFPSGLYYWTLLVGSTPITNRLYICTEEDAKRIAENG